MVSNIDMLTPCLYLTDLETLVIGRCARVGVGMAFWLTDAYASCVRVGMYRSDDGNDECSLTVLVDNGYGWRLDLRWLE
jgi:hypothetical protein